MNIEKIRNLAIIAHVDHGKTTLVDGMFRQSGIFRDNQHVVERVMDSNDLERERGITILSKNTSINYKDYKFNIVDTPGHADFGGEVERIVQMVDGVLLLVDAFEGPMPQTRFVLRKALEAHLKPIVVINKIDRNGARPLEVVDEVIDLFIDLGADEEQLDFPVMYAIAREGIATPDPEVPGKDLQPLFEMISQQVPMPEGDREKPMQMGVSVIDYSEYLGRMAIGRVTNGVINNRENIAVVHADGEVDQGKISKLYIFDGLNKKEVEKVEAGDIAIVAGIEDINIGDTLCDSENPQGLDFVKLDEPTISMTFMVNKSGFAGREGAYVTSRKLRERLFQEIQSDVSLRVEETDSPDAFRVSGRGELHLSILIETMRRQGYEIEVSRPEIILKEIDGKKCEPIECLIIDVPEEYMGVVMEKLGTRKAEMKNMINDGQGQVRLEFDIPSRGLFGYRSEFLSDTKGLGIMNHSFDHYETFKGQIESRSRGSLIASDTGTAVAYGMENAQERGTLFIGPGVEVYEGMIVGENARPMDMEVNVCKKKQQTNVRSSTADISVQLTPPRQMSLEQCMEFIADDELLEITPENLRMRKRILNAQERKRARNRG